MHIYTILFMLFVASFINVLAWIGIGYVVGTYLAKYSKCGKYCSEVAGVFGSLAGGFLTFVAYGMPSTLLWANNLIFAFVGALGLIYIVLPEKERAIKVEQFIHGLKKLSHLSIDLASFKR